MLAALEKEGVRRWPIRKEQLPEASGKCFCEIVNRFYLESISENEVDENSIRESAGNKSKITYLKAFLYHG